MVPKVGIIALTNKCNARCGMCNIWKKDSSDVISLELFEKIFKDPMLSQHLESINLTGGEPTLRKDLLDIAKLALENCKNLKGITFNTNGMNTNLVVNSIIGLCNLMATKPFSLQCFLSLDGEQDIHDEVRGVKGAYKDLLNTLEHLDQLKKDYHFNFSLNFTINRHNTRSMEKVYDFCKDNEYKIDYTYSMPSSIYFDNEEQMEAIIDKSYENKVAEFLSSKLMDGQLGNSRSYYRNLIQMLKGGKRKIGCIFQEEGFFLNANGDCYKCWAVDNKIGNIQTDTFSDVWKQANLVENITIVKDKCLDCYNNCYAKYKQIDSIKTMLRNII